MSDADVQIPMQSVDEARTLLGPLDSNARLIREVHGVSVLARDGIQVNQTLVFTVNQALLGANAGSTVVSPFVGRLDDIGQDGMALVRDIVDVYRQQAVETHVMAASIRGARHCVTAARAGAHISTVPYSVLMQMVKHPLTDAGWSRFLQDWQQASGG